MDINRLTVAEVNRITGQIVDSAFKVHMSLGPGLLEGAYKACLTHELRKRGLTARNEVAVPLYYDGIEFEVAYRIDILVEETVVVETKSVAAVIPLHRAQLLSHLRLGNHPVGLLINFNVKYLRAGITRIVNGLDDRALEPGTG